MFESGDRPALEEPKQAPPWKAEDGPAPVMWRWPDNKRPALSVLIGGRWVYASVTARADYPTGVVVYHVDLVPPGESGGTHRAYYWPQDGIRAAHGSSAQPTRAESGPAADPAG